MNKHLVKFGAIALMLGFSACEKAFMEPLLDETPAYVNLGEKIIIPNHYVVLFHENVVPEYKFKAEMNYSQKSSIVKDFVLNLEKEITGNQLEITNTYFASVQGFAGELTPEMVEKLRKDPRVRSIEQDFIVSLGKPGGTPGGGGSKDNTPPAQEVPYGIDRVGYGTYTGSKTVWVIDTGVDLDHPDLNVDANDTRHASYVNGSPDDQNGHGTHVAGTIGAIDNSIGVVGVAAGVEIVSVRVLDRRGSGSYSGVIGGVDYVADNASAGDVANMSLGGSPNSGLDNAVKAAAGNGILFALAAGNESDDADNHSPARANHYNIFTVSAMNSSDNFASFSNYGSSVDYCEPGVSIKSTWKGGGYNTISGTSMASPHMAGILVWASYDYTNERLNSGAISTDGTVNNDPDGDADDIAVK